MRAKRHFDNDAESTVRSLSGLQIKFAKIKQIRSVLAADALCYNIEVQKGCSQVKQSSHFLSNTISIIKYRTFRAYNDLVHS